MFHAFLETSLNFLLLCQSPSFIQSFSFRWLWKTKQTGISRPYPAPRLTLLPNTRAHIDVLDRNKNFQKKPHIFLGAYLMPKFPQIKATAWEPYTYPFSSWQVSNSSPVNGTQMLMYSWYPREYQLKGHFSKSESMIIGRFSVLVIDCKTFSSSIFCLTDLELLLPDCSLCKVLQCSTLFECYHSMSDSKV